MPEQWRKFSLTSNNLLERKTVFGARLRERKRSSSVSVFNGNILNCRRRQLENTIVKADRLCAARQLMADSIDWPFKSGLRDKSRRRRPGKTATYLVISFSCSFPSRFVSKILSRVSVYSSSLSSSSEPVFRIGFAWPATAAPLAT